MFKQAFKMVISKAQIADNQYGKSVSQIPSTAQNTEKQRFMTGKSLLFFVIGTETGQNEVFVQLSIKRKPLDSNIL